MTKWFTCTAFALSLGLLGGLPVSAQPGPRGGSGKGGSVQEIEAEIAKLRDHINSLENKLDSAKRKQKEKARFESKGRLGKGEKGKFDDRGRFGKGEKGKHNDKGRHGFGHRPGSRGPMHGFGHRGPMHGFGHRGPMHGSWGRGGFGSMHSPKAPMRGKGEEKKAVQDQRGKQGSKGAYELKGTIRSKEAPKSSGPSSLDRKLDQLQKDLEEIRRELKRR